MWGIIEWIDERYRKMKLTIYKKSLKGGAPMKLARPKVQMLRI
jgi:hypothetical protein